MLLVFFHYYSKIMIATALGIRWKLGPPYRSGIDSAGEYVPTPPGASMHFEYDLETGALDLSYLYPVYPLDDTDVDFSLKKAPLVFYPELNSIEGLVKVSQKRSIDFDFSYKIF